MKFIELSEKRQVQIKDLLLAKCTLKGISYEKSLESLLLREFKAKKWHSFKWYLMCSVDKHREKFGLSRLYS